MPAIIQPTYAASSSHRPILDSYDSSEECSFYHWMEVCKLVDDAEFRADEWDPEYSRQIAEALEQSLSEVEPASAYQHFAGNVV